MYISSHAADLEPCFAPLCRSLNQLRKDLAHKLTARQGKSSIPVPAGLDQEQTGYDASPTSTAPGVTLSPRVTYV